MAGPGELDTYTAMFERLLVEMQDLRNEVDGCTFIKTLAQHRVNVLEQAVVELTQERDQLKLQLERAQHEIFEFENTIADMLEDPNA